MVLESSFDGPNTNFNFSKWWPFRLINIISILSLISLFTILLVPIPYFDKVRKPTIVNYSFNSYPYSHAIRLEQTSITDNLTSITLSTYNSDHIIGTVTFGDFSLDYDSEYMYRFINVHYIKDRREFPVRLIFVDVYPDRFQFKKFTIRNTESQSYHLADSTIYYISDYDEVPRQLNISLTELLKSVPKGIYMTKYLDEDEKVVTEYFAARSAIIGAVTVGNTEVSIQEGAIDRTITTVLHPSLDIVKVTISTIFEGNTPPTYKAFYFSNSNHNLFYHNINDLNASKNLKITDEEFKIKKIETPKTVTLPFETNQDKLLKFEFENNKFKYDIYLTHENDSIMTFSKDSRKEMPQNQGEPVLDRMLVAKYKKRLSSKEPSYYLFDRMLHYNKQRSIHF